MSSRDSQTCESAAPAATGVAPILRVCAVTKRFGGVTAVLEADLDLEPGKVTSLIGPNGAGKTTLFNAITGCIPATEGKIIFSSRKGERRIESLRPDQITSLGIARTFQNIRLFSNLSVLDNVKIGFHARTRAGFVGAVFRPPGTRTEERSIETSALRYLEFCGLDGHDGETAGSLPYGLQRRLEIARALATAPSLLLLDEPAAGMNPSESKELLDTHPQNRCQRGDRVPHRARHAGRDEHLGHDPCAGPWRDHRPRVAGRDTEQPRRRRGVSGQGAVMAGDAARALLELSAVESGYGSLRILKGVSFEVREGEIVTLIGSNGAGKTTVLNTVCGVVPARAGTIRFAGRDITRAATSDIAGLGLAHVPEGRKLFTDMTVLENLQMGAYLRRDGAQYATM